MKNKLKKKACCPTLMRIGNDPESCLSYNDRISLFGMMILNMAYRSREPENVILGGDTMLKFCVWSGNALPNGHDLNNQWIKLVEKNYPGIDIYNEEELIVRLSKKFFSDEWQKFYNVTVKKNTKEVDLLTFFLLELKSCNNEKRAKLLLQKIHQEEQRRKDYPLVCCSLLFYNIYSDNYCLKHKNSNLVCSEFPIVYQPQNRVFYWSSLPSMLRLHKSYEKEKTFYRVLLTQIFHCPWCGTTLPKSLAPEWFKIVTSEFGVTNIFNQKQLTKKLPPEFLTEEWWRERRL